MRRRNMIGRTPWALLLALVFWLPATAGDTEVEKEFRVAASVGDLETVQRLLDQGLDVDTANRFDKTTADDGH